MGEGKTPFFRLRRLERKLKLAQELWAKAEYANPTGSFKDRGTLAEINLALNQNKRGVVCASTGNMAASLAAYSSRANLTCVVFIPANTPAEKVNPARLFGAKIIRIDGSYDNCVSKASEYAGINRFLLCGDYETRRFGQSGIGTELACSGIPFDSFIVPVGNGTVGCAVSQGLAVYGLFPKFIGVQGKGSDPIYRSWKANKPIIPIAAPVTVASAIRVGAPLDAQITLDWIRKTGGGIVSVTDYEIRNYQRLLARMEGIFVETAAAATIAGLKFCGSNPVRTVLILTGRNEGGDDDGIR